MARVRLTALGMEHFTGNLGKVRFVDGVSGVITQAQAEVVGAAYKAVLVQANGTTVIGPASPAARAATEAPDRAAAAPSTDAPANQLRLDLEPLYVKQIDALTYTLSQGDAGYLLNFSLGTEITIPSTLQDGFYCNLRQAGVNQIEVAAVLGVVLDEIDGNFKSEKRLAVLSLSRLPDGSFQLTGRTAE